MSTLTAQVQHQGSLATIRLAGYLFSEAAGTVEEAFHQAAGAGKMLHSRGL